MTTTTDMFRTTKASKLLTEAERTEKARRAVTAFRKMQPTLSAFARALTKRSDVQVVMDSGSPRTDGKSIYFRPPIALGEDHKHQRNLCERRDKETLLLLCPACAAREEVLIVIYHEISHIAFDTFRPPTEEQKKEIVRHAVEAAGGKHAEAISARIKAAPYYVTGSYLGLASLVSEYLPVIVNALEDARVNREMFRSRPGTKVMFEGWVRDTFDNGVEQSDRSVILWRDYPLNAQVTVGLFAKAAGYDYGRWFADEVVTALADEKLEALINRMDSIRSTSGVYELAFPVLQRLRELGFCKLPEDPEPEEPQDEEEPDDAEGDSSGEDGEPGSSEDSAPEDSGSDPGEASDDDASGDSEDAEASEDNGSSDDEGSAEPDESSDEGEGTPDAAGNKQSDDDGNRGDSQDQGSESDDDSDEDDSDSGAAGTEPEGAEDASGGSGGGTSDPEESETTEVSAGSGAAPAPGVSDSEPDAGEESVDTPSDDTSEPTEDGTDDGAGEDDPSDDGEPIDTGADEGKGGTTVVREDGAPEPEYGDPADANKALKVFGDHVERPTSVPEAQDNEAVDIAIIQGMYFEQPSTEVNGVRIHRFDDKNDTEAEGWSHRALRNYGISLQDGGVGLDTHVEESILGPCLLRMRVAFADNARAAHQHNLKSGRIRSRALGRRAWGDDERLFQKKSLPGKKDYFVVIGIDISGSTTGINIRLAKRAAMAQAELCNRAGIAFAVYCHTASRVSGKSGLSLEIYEIKGQHEIWTDKQRKALEDIGPVAENLDGHSIEFYRKRLDESTASDKIIMYYTDGKMPAANHDEELEILRREINTCKKKGYTLMGVGIRTDSPVRHGLDTVQVDDDRDMMKVVKHLEKKLK